MPKADSACSRMHSLECCLQLLDGDSFNDSWQLAYLDALDGIESRWDVFFSRFALMGALNPEFKEQTDTYLESMGMNTERFREVLKEAHELMRCDAEKERDGQL